MSQINKKDNYKIEHIQDRPWSYSEIEYWKNPKDNVVNATILFNDKRSRLRAGILIVKDDTVLLGEEADEKGLFSIPGGGLAENETPVDAAVREAKEEVYINVTEAIDTCYDYCECHSEVKDWVRKNVPEKKWWYNYYTCLIIARFESDYTGKVDDVDKDPSMNGTAHWYKIKDVIDKPGFKKEWKNALIDFGFYRENLTESNIKDMDKLVVKESLSESTQSEEARISDVLNILKDIKYGFISKIDNKAITNREWIHNCDLPKYYDVETNPVQTIKNKLGICQDQAIVIKYLMNKYHPEDKVQLYAITKADKGHCVACYCHTNNWYYLENAWDKAKGLHGPFNSQEDVENYLKDLYTKQHLEDTPEDSETKIKYYKIPINLVESRQFYEDLKDEAKKYFGTTENIKTAFYINTDGTLLDGSGAKLGARNTFRRSIDHREISAVVEAEDGYEAMMAYIREGNIRWTPETSGFELIKEPTAEQYQTMSKIIKSLHYNCKVDIEDTTDRILYSKSYSIWDDPIEDIENYFSKTITEDENLLLEDTRAQLVSASKNAGPYKDQTRGKNRFERKKFSKVTKQTESLNTIDMNKLFKSDLLEIQIPVTGETNNYVVTIQMDGVIAEIARNIKANHNIFEYKVIIQSLTKIFNTTNIRIHCSCPDYSFNFAHWSVINNYGTLDSAHDPGPGKGIANPNNNKGRTCKHALAVLNNQNWLLLLGNVIKNYIFYMAEHKQNLFNRLMFPKLYGLTPEDAQAENIIPEETNLATDKNLIDTINMWAKNRGKFTKGTNKNTAKNKIQGSEKNAD